MLIEKGADINAKDKWQQTPLDLAKRADVNANDTSLQTPPDSATATGLYEIMQMLKNAKKGHADRLNERFHATDWRRWPPQ